MKRSIPLMMGIAVSSSMAFLSPVVHPANLLIMGTGGCRSSDHTRVGVTLTLVELAEVLLLAPNIWPFLCEPATSA